jgi:hypothetical protein
MPSQLAGDTCIGQHSVCVMRAARLGADCAPVGGANSGIVTAGIVTATATPEYRETRRIEPTNGCGAIAFTYEEVGCKLRETLSGEVIFHDWEMLELLFGGGTILGASGGPFAGDVIGWYGPSCPDEIPDSIYLEFIVKNSSQDSGECQTADSEFPTYTGHVFGKVQLTSGAKTFNDQAQPVPFDGFAVKNPNLVLGPWNDYPGAGVMPSSPHFEVGYSTSQFEAILADVRCGYQDLPVHYSG